jgi:hypothetical protein
MIPVAMSEQNLVHGACNGARRREASGTNMDGQVPARVVR